VFLFSFRLLKVKSAEGVSIRLSAEKMVPCLMVRSLPGDIVIICACKPLTKEAATQIVMMNIIFFMIDKI
jgi:hypothetical protein